MVYYGEREGQSDKTIDVGMAILNVCLHSLRKIWQLKASVGRLLRRLPREFAFESRHLVFNH